MRRGLAAALISALAASAPASAADKGGCGVFKWPVEADIALLASAERAPSGATLDIAAPKAARVELVDGDRAGFEVQPEKPFAAAAPAGVLRFEAKAGLYQVTTTDRIWIDAVQNGKATKMADFPAHRIATGRVRACGSGSWTDRCCCSFRVRPRGRRRLRSDRSSSNPSRVDLASSLRCHFPA